MNTKEKKEKKVIKLRKSSHDIWMSSLLVVLVCTGLLGVGLSSWNYSNGINSGDINVDVGDVVDASGYFKLNTMKGDVVKTAHGYSYTGIDTIKYNSYGLVKDEVVAYKGELTYFLSFNYKKFAGDFPSFSSAKIQFALNDHSGSFIKYFYFSSLSYVISDGSSDISSSGCASYTIASTPFKEKEPKEVSIPPKTDTNVSAVLSFDSSKFKDAINNGGYVFFEYCLLFDVEKSDNFKSISVQNALSNGFDFTLDIAMGEVTYA